MRQSIAIVSLLASAACAQDVVSYIFPGGADSPGVATVESVNPSTTQFKIACPTGVDETECGWGPGVDYTVISQTRYEAMVSVEGFSMGFACDAIASGNAVCTVTQSGTETMTATLSGTDAAFITASVVQGASLLSGGAASAMVSATGSAGSAQSTSGLMVATGSSPAPSGVSMTPSASHSGSAAEHTGAAARFGIEGSALAALVGAAAFML